jgi:hypothetical protein
MKFKHLLVVVAFAAFSAPVLTAADAPKKAPAKEASKKAPAKSSKDSVPFYGKVTAVTSRTLTIVRSEGADAPEVKLSLTAATEYVNGDKPSSFDAVKIGSWVGGAYQKATGDGNDTVLKLNVGVKQKAAEKGKSAPKKKGDAEKKTEPKKKSDSKKKSE